MRPTIDDLRKLWLITYSRSSLCEADRWIEAMASVESDETLMKGLICAAVVAYARPFTESRLPATTVAIGSKAQKWEKVVPLRNVVPPNTLSSTHDELLDLRSKVFGHQDATPAKGHSETANKLLLRIDASGEIALYATPAIEMKSYVRQEMKALCSHFIAHCEQQFDLLAKKYRAEFNLKPGPYQIFVCEPPDDWIKPGWPDSTTTNF